MLTTAPATLDLLDPTFRVDSPAVRAAAERTWYAQTALGLAVLHYDDCARLMRDRRVRRPGAEHMIEQGVTTGILAEQWPLMVFNMTGPDHDRIRRAVAPAFTHAAIDRLREQVREIVGEFVETIAPAGRCEFVAEFAEQFPPRVMFAMLGLDPDRCEEFIGWAKDIAHMINIPVLPHRERIEAALTGLAAVTDDLCAQRRGGDGDDLISVMVNASGNLAMSPAEIRAMVSTLVFGGQDSTRCQLSHAMELFARHPEQWALLAERPELAEAAADEAMRALSTVPIIWRIADMDFEWRGVPIAAGTRMWMMVGSAHVDPAVFPDPDFDIAAERASHLTFGLGRNFCLGAHLARLEMVEALQVLARRMPDLALDGEVVRRHEMSGFVGPDVLPLRFTPTTR